MGNLFNKSQQNAQPLSERALLENKYNSSRYNLLLVVIFSLINVLICVFGGDTYFLFSASLPYYIAFMGAFLGGIMPDEYYFEMGIAKEELLGTPALVIFAIIAVVVIAFYFLFWLFSKKKVGWIIAALVFFVIDTVIMLVVFGISIDMIVDALFHVWVLVSLISGIVNYYKLKKLPEEIKTAPETDDFNDGFNYPETPADEFN